MPCVCCGCMCVGALGVLHGWVYCVCCSADMVVHVDVEVLRPNNTCGYKIKTQDMNELVAMNIPRGLIVCCSFVILHPSNI